VPTETCSLRDKVAIVTGASSGLGEISAKKLAAVGARLYLLCRSRERGEKVAREISLTTGNSEVRVLIGDLSSQSSIRAVASEFLSHGEPLHILLNNAGAMFGFRRKLSLDGIEMTFALNVE